MNCELGKGKGGSEGECGRESVVRNIEMWIGRDEGFSCEEEDDTGTILEDGGF